MVETYKLKNKLWYFVDFAKEYIYSMFYLLFSEIKCENNKNTMLRQDTFCSAQINEQAKRLMISYGNNILRLAYSYLHNIYDAEDVLQDTLIQFITKQPLFDTDEHEKAWLLRVAINISKNKISYNRIRKTDELSETLAAKETEDLSFVWDAVKQLSPKYSEVIHLFYHEGYSTAQIALLLSKKESTKIAK